MARSVPQSIPYCDLTSSSTRAVLDSKQSVMRSLLLFLPRSLRVAAEEAPSLEPAPALRRLLSRARATRFARQDQEATLLQAFGVVRQHDWPVAPLTWLGDGGSADERFWLRADPVHLRAERDALVLVDASRLKLEGAAVDSLVGSLNAHFDRDGLRFHAPAPARWYVSLPQAPDVATCPLSDVAGRSVNPLLPHGKDALTWHRRWNEVQMLLHEHPINQAREAAGEPSINSVWFWGGGTLPRVERRGFACVWGHDPFRIMRGNGWTRPPTGNISWCSKPSPHWAPMHCEPGRKAGLRRCCRRSRAGNWPG
jgi:hypothetical protein